MAGLPPTIAKKQASSKSNGSLLSKEIKIPFLPEVPEKQAIEFTRNLAVMLKAKLPLVKALDTSIEQITHKRLKEIVTQIRKDVRKGKSLSKALAAFPDIFDTIYVQLTEVGEVSGVLDEVLLRLSMYKEKAFKLKQKVKMALVYPSIIITVAIAAVSFLLIFVVPTFVDMYQDFEADLPGPTLVILSISEFLTSNILFILGILLLLFFGIRFSIQTKKGREVVDTLKLKIPYFGEMYSKGLVSQFTSTLSTLLNSGVILSESLGVLKNSSNNVILENEISKMLSSIKKGRSLNRSLSKSKIFPIMVIQMISVGEETASLDEMLNQVATLYEDEVDLMVEGLTSVIEPILIVFIGLILGVIIVALYLPIFEMVNVVG
ncbi:MAG: type II secretion system F family protein [Balneolaceae bacterium]|nr:type II secretion system F family protein [Balneolaceae bacterium]MBO6546189.1 type II secretion system F family protein [Balneolaceae bacterium]MBO6648548.1 type II secretion system F family protein [Balneolaceae bacterium]